MRSFREYQKESFKKNPKLKEEYEKLKFEFQILDLLMEQRIKYGLTQKQLAEKIGTKQSAISRLENGNYNPTVNFLQKIADALDIEIQMHIVPKKNKHKSST